MSEGYEFLTYRDIDYVNTLNRAIQHIYFTRANLRDLEGFIDYLRAVEALYAILIPRLRPPKAGELLKEAKKMLRKKTKLRVNAKALDDAVNMMIEQIDKSGLLIRGIWLEHNAPEPELMKSR